jgi:hypothetical protein
VIAIVTVVAVERPMLIIRICEPEIEDDNIKLRKAEDNFGKRADSNL